MEKNIKERDAECLEKILDKIKNTEITRILDELNNSRKNAGLPMEELPDIREMCNKKLHQLKQQFNEAGITMMIRLDKDGHQLELSSIGSAITQKLVEYMVEAIDVIKETQKQGKTEEKSLVTQSRFSNFIGKIRQFFKGNKDERRKEQEVKDKIQKEVIGYKTVCDKVENYNLKDNLEDSLITYVRDNKKEFISKNIFEESITPDLIALKMDKIIPSLKKEVDNVRIKDAEALERNVMGKYGVKDSEYKYAVPVEKNDVALKSEIELKDKDLADD